MRAASAFLAAAGVGAALALAACGSGEGVATTPSPTQSAPSSQQPSSSPSAGLPGTGASDRTVTVVGTGSVIATPDVAVAILGVTMTGNTALDAVNAATFAADKLTRSLVASGVSQNDISTTDYGVSQHWNPVMQRPEGWEVRDGLTVVIRDVGKAGTVIASAAAAVPNVFWVSGVRLDRENTSAIIGAAREAAIKDARARAAGWAQLTGRSLGDIVSVSEQQPDASYAVPNVGGIGGAAGGIVSGTGRLAVTVTVVFSLS